VADVVRTIGLSLGADLCWPKCYEEIVRRSDLALPVGKDRVRFEVERTTIEPFDLRAPCRYDLVLDRITHWYPLTREWMKKVVVMDDVYVLNNPWAIQSMEKNTTYAAMMRLGMPVPDTWMVPPKDYDWTTQDLKVTLERYARLFDLGKVGERLGYPLFMKPYDGGAWVGVVRIDDEKALRKAYEESGRRVMQVQKAVHPYDLFVRCIGVGPQTRILKYDASAPLHARYRVEKPEITEAEASLVRDMTLTINTFFGWDFNSCEALRQGSEFLPIDFANACPDSQVTSLHYHHPWLVKALVKWTLFCAATKRRVRHGHDWEPYFEVARRAAPFRERLAAYAAIARKRLDADRFEEFAAKHLARVDEVAFEFYGTAVAKEAIRAKVAALFPKHEVEEFTERFWAAVQRWRDEEGRPA
jgi:glutathione synthase/RimK-type ligase-like ATP-grasp enzyme